jgi:hypothetical protein
VDVLGDGVERRAMAGVVRRVLSLSSALVLTPPIPPDDLRYDFCLALAKASAMALAG